MLNKNIKELRISKGYTQSDAAKIFGITAPAYSAYESGKSIPPLDKLIHISKHYDVSLDWLCGLLDERPLFSSIGDIALLVHELVSGSKFSLSLVDRKIGNSTYTDIQLTSIYKNTSHSLTQFLQDYLDMKKVLDKKQISIDVFNEWLKPRIQELSKQ